MDDDFAPVLRAFRRHLAARNKAEKTISGYLEAGQQFADWLRADPDRPRSFAEAGRVELEEFFGDLFAQGRSASTVANRYRSLQQLYRWLFEIEEEIEVSPFVRLRPPEIPEQDVEVIDVDHMRLLLAACKAPKGAPAVDRFIGLRDTALIRLLYDTGVRAAEVMGLTVDEVDMEMEVIHVHGKGRRDRAVPFGVKAGTALDRYLRVRAKHPHARRPEFWLAQKGGMTDSGLRQMLERRARLAGLPHIHPHQLRHSAADAFYAAGGQQKDAKRLFGWKSDQMAERYGSVNAVRRAHEAKRNLSPGDKV